MKDNDTLIDSHYGFGGIMETIEAGLKEAGKDPDAVTVDDLAPVDEFHTRGRESTLEVAELAGLSASDHVIDVGCGLGGTARHLVHDHGCRVTGVDLTEEYIAVGTRLNEMVGMDGRLDLRQGNALDLPFDDATFDVAWTEHVQMNIPDKKRFYGEMARVLKPGGRLVFHDVFRGEGPPPFYPVPWAEDESISVLATQAEARAAMEAAGLRIEQWIDKAGPSLAFFKRVSAKIEADGLPPVGIHVLMGANAPEKLANYVRNLSEDRTAVAMGLARKP